MQEPLLPLEAAALLFSWDKGTQFLTPAVAPCGWVRLVRMLRGNPLLTPMLGGDKNKGNSLEEGETIWKGGETKVN